MTIIYPSPIFGPVHSRRLGISLGINLMPADGKICTFDCIYCECGFNSDFRPKLPRPTREEIAAALEQKLKEMSSEKQLPDVLTFAGNGEPTAHPKFAEIIDDTIKLRDRYCKNAKVSVLSNATLIGKKSVFDALLRVDNNILKLDTTDPIYINNVDRPLGRYDVREIIEGMRAFSGRCIIQTMFMHSKFGGMDKEHIDRWLDAVDYIKPSQVMIYTIDRETPDSSLKKATHEELDAIKAKVEALGIACSASY